MSKLAFCLALALVSNTQAKPNDPAGCMMANTNAINDVIDSALFAFASTKDCGKDGKPYKCTADIASVAHSAVGVANFILEVVKTCGEIKTSNLDCAIAATGLTEALGTITAQTTLIVGDCPKKADVAEPWTGLDAGTCSINVAGAMSGLQAAITSMMVVKGKCDTGNGGKCFAAVMDIISALGALGNFLEMTIANCDTNVHTNPDPCIGDIAGLLSGLSATASTATTISETCTKKSTRLYQDSHGAEMPTRAGANLMSYSLLVFLPIIGMASFYGVSRFSRDRQARHTQLVTAPADE